MSLVRLAAGGLLLLPAIAFIDELAAARTAADMGRAASEFVASLTPEQRERAVFAFADPERLNWHFVPRERRGLPLKDMTEPQRALARALLQAGMGARGYLKASTVMDLERALRELGGSPAVRDPELYYFSIFGTPSAAQPWGWRAEGHHLSLNFTIVRGTLVATAPAFLGANPARVPSGTLAGLRALAREEDLARDLVRSLDAAQRAVAVLPHDAPRDIVTGNAVRVDPLSPAGIAARSLRADQKTVLRGLIDEYLLRMADDLAAERRARLAGSDFDAVTFAWAGTLEPGGPHYYRVQGPTFLIEYDNTQNDANHIHSVWRDFDGDFGRDLLRDHYLGTPHPQR